MKTTAQTIENGFENDAQMIDAMRGYKREFAQDAPPDWVAAWFQAAWHLLRARGWSWRELGAELDRAAA
jgi:hypothetical protein